MSRPACPCGCDGQIDRHDDRGWGPWACPVCDDDSDTDLGKPCSRCAGKGDGPVTKGGAR